MQNKLWLVGFLFAFIFATSAFCDEEEDLSTVQGKVVVTRGDDGSIAGVALATVDWDENDNEIKIVYNLVLDAKTKKIAEKHEGKEIEVSGKLVNKGTEAQPNFWMTVKSYEDPDEL